MSDADKASAAQLDMSDVDQWIGKPVIFAELWDPCNATHQLQRISYE